MFECGGEVGFAFHDEGLPLFAFGAGEVVSLGGDRVGGFEAACFREESEDLVAAIEADEAEHLAGVRVWPLAYLGLEQRGPALHLIGDFG